MKRLIIELNDLEIRQILVSAGEARQLTGNEEGIAWRDGNNLAFGNKASAARARAPRDLCDHYWDRLDTSTIGQGSFQCNLAELAAEHLRRLVDSDLAVTEVIAVVPPHYSPEQCGILTSITRDLQIPLRYIIPRPIACAISGDDSSYLHVDISLHSLQISIVNRGPVISFKHLSVKRDLGYLSFLNQWLNGIAAEFVSTCRIDPLHSADGELTIRGAIPQVLQQLLSDNKRSVPVSINSAVRMDGLRSCGDQAQKIEVTESMMTGWTISRMSAIAKEIESIREETSGILLGYSVSRIPGLHGLLSRELEVPITRNDDNEVIAGVGGDWPLPAAGDRCLYLSQRPRNTGGS